MSEQPWLWAESLRFVLGARCTRRPCGGVLRIRACDAIHPRAELERPVPGQWLCWPPNKLVHGYTGASQQGAHWLAQDWHCSHGRGQRQNYCTA